VEQNPIVKFRQKPLFQPEMAVLHLKTITKNTKDGDKTLSPNSSFLMPKLVGYGFLSGKSTAPGLSLASICVFLAEASNLAILHMGRSSGVLDP